MILGESTINIFTTTYIHKISTRNVYKVVDFIIVFLEAQFPFSVDAKFLNITTIEVRVRFSHFYIL